MDEHEREPKPYEPPAIEELEAGDGPAVTAAGGSGATDFDSGAE